MRIVARGTLAIPSWVGALAAAAVVAGGVVFVALLTWSRIGPEDDAGVASRRLTMADALGIAGLGMLSVGDPRGTSAIDSNVVVAYYGAPRSPEMGILGQHEPAELATLLEERASRFRAAPGGARVLPAFHIVYGIAQPEAGSSGLYLQYVDELSVRRYLRLAREHGYALVLDLQIGHSEVMDEVRKVEPYLLEPDVFLALDPEFALRGGAEPGAAIGSIHSGDINRVQEYLAALAHEHGLPKKLLIVHQFEPEMIGDAAAIEQRGDVDVIIDMDGYGAADIKQVKYARYGAAPYAQHGGIKLFLDHDPDLLSEAELLALEPRPALIVYQ